MRGRSLARSVRPFLGGSEPLEISWGYRRPIQAVATGAAVALAVGAALALAGVPGDAVVAVGVFGGVSATAVMSEQHAFARGPDGWRRLRCNPVRLVAKEDLGPIDPDRVALVGGNLLVSEWDVDGIVYQVPKRAEARLERMLLDRA